MNRLARLATIRSATFLGLALASNPETARAAEIDTVLRRGVVVAGWAAVEGADAREDGRSRLGPDRLQGDFVALVIAGADSDAGSDRPTSPGTDTSTRSTSTSDDAQPGLHGPILGAVVGGAVGFVGIGYLAAVSADDAGSEGLEVLGAFLAAGLAAEVVLMPLGAHLGNGRRGSYLVDLGVSALSAVAAIVLMSAVDFHAAAVGAGTGLHLGVTIAAERKVARDRAAQHDEVSP